MIEPVWLEVDEVVALNRDLVSLTGETHFLRDLNLLESALSAPKNFWHYESPHILICGCKLIFALAKSHAFEQGNKRTAFYAGAEFFMRNGAEFDLPDTEPVAAMVEALTIGTMTPEAFAYEIRRFVIFPDRFVGIYKN